MAKTTLGDRELLHLVDLAYDAAHDSTRWGACLQALSKSVGGHGAILLHHDLSRGGTISESVEIDPEAIQLYGSHYHQVDPWAQAPRAADLLRPGRAIPDHWLVPRSELKRTEHYSDFSQRFNLSRIVSLSLLKERYHSGVSILRSERDPEFSVTEVRFLEAVIPHLQRALRIAARLSVVETQLEARAQGLNALPHGFAVTDADARVLWANKAAAAMLLSREGLGIVRGSLITSSAASQTELRRLCASATGADGIERGGSTRFPTPLGAWLHVLVAPAGRTLTAEGPPHRPAAIVFISDPSRHHPPDETRLRRLFGLTAAEARIVGRLAAGWRLDAIADERKLKLETVRWFNKQILSKLGCRNRAELARMISGSLASLRTPAEPE